MIKTSWEKLKVWFKRSETIFLARMTAIVGFVTAAVGQFDWAPLWSFLSTGTEFTSKQLLWIGVSIAGYGLTMEIARRRGTKEIDGNLIPTAASVTPVKIKTKTPKKSK